MSSKPPATRARPLSKTALSTALSSTTPIALDTVAATTAPTRRGLSSSVNSTPISSTGTGLAIRTLAWSPTGALLATADARTCRVWNPERPGIRYSSELKLPASASVSTSTPTPASTSTPTPAARPPPTSSSSSAQHLTGTERVAWNPTRESELATIGTDGYLRFFDIRSKSPYIGSVKTGGEGFSLAWRPDGTGLVAGRKDDVLVVVDRRAVGAGVGGRDMGMGVGGKEGAVGGKENAVVGEYRQTVQTNQICFGNSGRELFLTTGEGRVVILDFPSMDPLYTITPHTTSCYTVLPSPTGRHIATGGSDALITLWSTTDWTCRHTLPEIGGPVRSLSFSFDGSYVVGGTDEVGGSVGGGRFSGYINGMGLGGGGGEGEGDVTGAAAGTAGLQIAHVETGEYVHVVETKGAAPFVQWHPSRYVLAWGEEGGRVRVLGVGA